MDELEADGHGHDLRYLGGWEGLVLEAAGRIWPGVPDLEAAVVLVLAEEHAAGRLDRGGPEGCDWASVEERVLVAAVHLS